MVWNPADNKSDMEFIVEARHHNPCALRNHPTGRWLDAALRRLAAALGMIDDLQRSLLESQIGRGEFAEMLELAEQEGTDDDRTQG